MSQSFFMTCPECGRSYSSDEWGDAGAPQNCPDCGATLRTEWCGDDEDEDDRGRNGVNFGQDW